jgi:hypothetical protein
MLLSLSTLPAHYVMSVQGIYCCAIMASSQDLSFVYAIAWTALNLLVNPYMALFQGYSLGWGFSWLRFTSPFNFAWQALVKIEFSGRGFDCNGGSGLRAINIFPGVCYVCVMCVYVCTAWL